MEDRRRECQLIDELNQEHGVEGQIEWRLQHPAEFQWLVAERQAALDAAEMAAGVRLVYCDGGRPDAMAYAELYGLELNSEIVLLIGGKHYLRVFLLDTLTRFRLRSSTMRTSDRERSLRICDLLDEAYRSLGYSPVRFPELSIGDRARYVLSELGESPQGCFLCRGVCLE